MQFICLFAPAAISTKIYLKSYQENKNSNILLTYITFTFLINFLAVGVLRFYVKNPYNYFQQSLFNFDFSLKYMALALVLAIILPIFYKIIQKNFSINLEVKRKKHEKSSKGN